MAKPKGMIIIDVERCKGCELCLAACPVKIIFMDPAVRNSKGYLPATVRDMGDMARCIACCYCALVCPDVAITVERLEG